MNCCDGKTNKKIKDWTPKDEKKIKKLHISPVTFIVTMFLIGLTIYKMAF